MDKTKELGESHIPRLMLKYFIPAFIGVFVNALYNIVDRIFIGQGVSAVALSAVSVIFPVMLIMMAFGMLIGIGAGVLVSINMGRRNLQKAEHVLGNSFMLMILVSGLIMAIGFLIKRPMLEMFGATQETVGYANDYLNIILLGVVFQVVGFSLNNVIRSEGNARIAMYSMLLSAGLNMLLDPLFIFVFDLGVKGAAYATVLSMIALSVWVLFHFKSERSVVKIRARYFKLDWDIIKEILVIGMAPFFMQTANSAVQALINTKLIQFGGDLAVGAMGIVNSVITLIIMAIVAINMASQPIIGFNFGAKAGHRVKETLRLSMIAASVISIGAFIIVQAFPGEIVRLFNSTNPQLLTLGKQGLRLGMLALPIVGFQVVVGNFFQSVGKAKIATLLTLLRQVIVLIPLLFILPNFLELTGIWISMPISDICSALIVTYFITREWKLL
ncbi:MAG TPA: MATE family efflux transporter [Sunxiuqinia sp.]|nr:MATE family efflux transporter [Sunxiuqinia sp.]